MNQREQSMQAKLIELGYKYCAGEDEVLPLDSFYKTISKRSGRTKYSSLSKPHHQAQLKQLKEDRANKKRNPFQKQTSILDFI